MTEIVPHAPPAASAVRGRARRSFIAFAIAGLWAVGGYRYWSTEVPSVPDVSIDWPREGRVLGFTPAGLLAVAGERSIQGSRWPTGPVVFYDVTTGHAVRSIFNDQDRLVAEYQESHQLEAYAILRRPNAVEIASWEDGRTLLRVDDDGWSNVAVSPDKRHCAVISESGSRLFDLEQGRELWNRPAGWYLSFVDTQIALAHFFKQDGSHAWQQLDVVTGEVVNEARPKNSFNSSAYSQDRRWFLSKDADAGPGGVFRVHAAATGQIIWTVPVTPTSRKTGAAAPTCYFSSDSSQVCFHYPVGQYAARIAKYRAADGAPISPIPVSAPVRVQPATDIISDDGRWGITSVIRAHMVIPFLSDLFNGRLSRRTRLVAYLQAESRLVVIDNDRDQIHSMFPLLPNGTQLEFPGGTGFIQYTPQTLHYFAMPPKRNWGWLLIRVAIPVMLALAVGLNLVPTRSRRTQRAKSI